MPDQRLKSECKRPELPCQQNLTTSHSNGFGTRTQSGQVAPRMWTPSPRLRGSTTQEKNLYRIDVTDSSSGLMDVQAVRLHEHSRQHRGSARHLLITSRAGKPDLHRRALRRGCSSLAGRGGATRKAAHVSTMISDSRGTECSGWRRRADYCEGMSPAKPLSFVSLPIHYDARQLAVVGLKDVMALELVEWNDWFRWRTLFFASYFDESGDRHEIGAVKIAKLDHVYANAPEYATPLESRFESLGAEYVSVGQDEVYYANLRQHVGQQRARHALEALGDMAVRPTEFASLAVNDVVVRSLLRYVAEFTVTTTFANLAKGLGYSPYAFEYTYPAQAPTFSDVGFLFDVQPASVPPTNVHALIGPNGSGKTTHLRNMALALLGPEAGPTQARLTEGSSAHADFANLVYVSFSAFDDQRITTVNAAQYLPAMDDETRFDVRYSYVGLLAPGKIDTIPSPDSHDEEDLNSPRRTLSSNELTETFVNSAQAVFREKSRSLWDECVTLLRSDLYFESANVAELMDITLYVSNEDFARRARELFAPLSSGHKIVLLAVTRLVQTVTERSLVLIDEPESHLHPPLLAAYIRALSHLMSERNGVAIVSTHSPVALQEIPRSCVLRVTRTGASRLEVESFGESVGSLTRSVFSLEVEDSGFHKMLLNRALELRDYGAVVAEFDEQLGSEALAILAAWFADEGLPTRSHADRRTW